MQNGLTARVKSALWHDNPGLSQLLGLCPLLAVSDTLITALGLAVATVAALTLSNVLVALLRGLVRQESRLPFYVLIIATVVTVIDLSMQAWFYELHRALGIFVPLIAANCIILSRADHFARRNGPLSALLDGLLHGLGFGVALLVMGGIRELLGHGSLLALSGLMPGNGSSGFRLFKIPAFDGLLIVALPCGAFITLGALLAAKNAWDSRFRGTRYSPAKTVHNRREK